MNRRTVIAAIGSLATGSSLVVGTGAFTSVSTDRNVSVQTTDDYAAVLKLTQEGAGGRSVFDGNPSQLRFTLPSPRADEYPSDDPTDPQGLGTDSVYRFGRGTAGESSGLFTVENQGTSPVQIYGTQSTTTGVPTVSVYDIATESVLTKQSPSRELDVGEVLSCGLKVDTHNVSVQPEGYDVMLTLNAISSTV